MAARLGWRRFLRPLYLFPFVILGLAWFFFGNAKDESKPATLSQAQAPRGVGALGRVEPRSRVIGVSYDTGFEGARIEQIFAEEGQMLAKGERIALFSEFPRRKAERDAAAANIAVLKAQANAETVNERFAEKQAQRYAALLKRGAASAARQEDAARALAQSTANVRAFEAQITQAEANLALAEEKLRQSELRAPIDGTLLHLYAHPGERVGDKGVADMADLSQMDIVAEIYERDMARVTLGQKAEIIVPGIASPLAGVVRELGFQVRKNDLNDTDPLADRDNRVVEVRISVDAEQAKSLQHLIYLQVSVRLP